MTQGLRASTRVVVLAAAALLLVAGGISVSQRLGLDEPSAGVTWLQTSQGPLAVQVEPDGPAARAGLREGDLLVRAEGRAVTSSLEAADLAWGVGDRSPLRLDVRRDGVELGVSLAPDRSPRNEPYLYLVVVGLACWASGLFVSLRWPRIRGGTIWALLAACLGAQLIFSHTGRGDALDWAIYWADSLAGVLWPALLIHLGVRFVRRARFWRRGLLAAGYSVAVLLAGWGLWLSPAVGRGAYAYSDPLSALETFDRVAAFVAALATLATAAILAKSHARSASGLHRSQMRWLLFGLLVGLGPYVMLYAVPWAARAAELPDWARFLSVAPMLLVPATFTSAIVRYRLYDLDLLLLRALAEVAAVFATFAVLAGSVFLLREGLADLLPLSRSASRYIGFLVAAVSYPQVRHWVRSGVERAFYRQRYSYRTTLLDWARELNAETDLSSLLTRLGRRVRETLGVTQSAVLVRTGHWRFETMGDDSVPALDLDLDEATLVELELRTAVSVDDGLPGVSWARHLFAMKVKGKLRAVLIVAERASAEEPLTTQDRALLGTLAAQTATAIEAARLVLEVRQRAEEIERLNARQERILESSAVGLLLLDGRGSIQAWNRSLEATYGLDRDDAIGRRLADVFPLHVARRIERECASPQTRSGTRIFRLKMTNLNGDSLLTNIAISPVDDASEQDGGYVVTVDDVTDRVRVEEQMAQHERLASLGLFAAGVAHEINTPLTGVSSFTQLLLEDESEHGRREVLRKIDDQAIRASRIANSLLNLARPDLTSFGELDLSETVAEALQLFEPQVRRRDIRLEPQLAEALPPVQGNRGKLQQVVLNLLLNARDAIGETGRISVTTGRDDGCAWVEVADNGVGIAEENLPKIFDPFFTTKGRAKGTGLGLSISYGIVQEHDGRIVAECAGGMTRFKVSLPLAGRARAMA